jgi:hypothetical protein
VQTRLLGAWPLHEFLIQRVLTGGYPEQPLEIWSFFGFPRGTSGKNSVDVDDEFSSACEEGDFVGFAFCDETSVELDESLIVLEGSSRAAA